MKQAVIKTGGKQYLVSEGRYLRVEKFRDKDLKEGDAIVFDEVLLIDDGKDAKIGAPTVSGAKVTGTVRKLGRNKTVIAQRYKAKSNFVKRYGHRQPWLEVMVDKIS